MSITRSTKWIMVVILGIGLLTGISFLFEKEHSETGDVTEHPNQAHEFSEADAGEKDERDEHDPNDQAASNQHILDEGVALTLSAEEIEEFGIALATASRDKLATTLRLPGEVVIDPGALVHVVPPVAGVVREVFKRLGERVSEGELLATLASRELAEAKAQLIATSGRLALANATLQRERELYRKKITAEREYLEARQAQAEVAIELKAARQRLMALGLSTQGVGQVLHSPNADLTLYELKAPSAGVILEKHITHGELLETDDRAFAIADLNTVWVNLTVHQKDLPLVNRGQSVVVSAGFGIPDTNAVIDYVGPTVVEDTRTATARVILDNRAGHWRPGLFVNGVLSVGETPAEVVVPRSALQTIDGQTIVYVKSTEGFEPRSIRIGRSDQTRVEVVQGLAPGEQYVSRNAFVLKAEMSRGAVGHGR